MRTDVADERRMLMPEEPTCGQGLAEHSELPLLMGQLVESVADNLRAHLPGLVSSDVNSQHEQYVYEHLAARLGEAGALLHAIGIEMAGHQDMPMGEHDLQALLSRGAIEALERMTRVEAQLVTRVQDQLTEHQAMLDTIRSDGE